MPLCREQVAWSVAGSGRLVMGNAQGQRTVAAFAQRGNTLTLIFPGHAPQRVVMRPQGTDTMTLRTLKPPQTDIYLARVASPPTP
ncbi:hypothetical protein [Hymenobacter algoricola]|uniref:DUF4115 domain-containing protein n=1 Tax=Hymenobacter algoricola TaxID=486267 RepID=A0ABP7NGH2_9BACT